MYVCEMQRHPEGRWIIGGEKYNPTWPRGNPSNYEEAEEMISGAINYAVELFQKTNQPS